MSKFKIGDKVVRKPEHRNENWRKRFKDHPAGAPRTVTAVRFNEIIELDHVPYGWDADLFDLVSAPATPKELPTPKAPDAVGTGMKYDAGKPRMDLLLDGCPNALLRISDVLTFGAKKYAAHSWHTVAEGKSRYKAALLRHLTAHAMGEVNDAESGLPHLAHAACCALFILELEQRDA